MSRPLKHLQVGMIWFMGGAETHTAVVDAAQYYEDKYRVIPDECHAHPDTLGDVRTVMKIKCVPDTSILTNHLWIGKK